MKKLNTIATTFALLVLTASASLFNDVEAKENNQKQTKDLLLGETINIKAIQSIETLMANPKQYAGQEVTIEGTIKKVCKVKGCWADFYAKDTKLRVKVKDGEIVIPIHAIGRKAYATGIFTAKELTKEKTIAYKKHMAKDAGEEFDPKSVTEGMTLYQLKSNAVKILSGE